LILRGEGVAADLKLKGLQNIERLAFGRQGLAKLAKVCAPVSKRDVLLEFRYCRKAEDFPFVGLAQQEPGQIVHMNALHDDHDRAGALIVKSRKQRIGEPLIGPRSLEAYCVVPG